MKKLIIIFLLLGFCGCAPSSVYIKGDRDTYNAIVTDYQGYYKNDPNLTSEQKQTRDDVVNSWDYRVKAAEEAK